MTIKEIDHLKKESQILNSVHVLVMCLADPSGNPRPKRAIELCKRLGYHISVGSYFIKTPIKIDKHFLITEKNNKTVINKLKNKFITLNIIIWQFFLRTKKLRDRINNYKFRLAALPAQLEQFDFNLIIVEDLQLLPVAHSVKGNTKILFDAREYYPKQHEDSFLFNILERPERIRLCKEYLSQCDALITVSEGLAREYEKEFYVHMDLIRSVPNRVDIPARPCGVNTIRMVHHGGANRNRKLENMIAVMEKLDGRFSLDFYLTGDQNYINELLKIAEENPRINFHKPVPFSSIISMLINYDIGFCFLVPTTFNLRYCLPNKLFEFIQARLMIAIGPSPDMANLVKKHDCGIVSPTFDPEEMARCLTRLTPELINKLKYNSDVAAKELCFEREGKKLEKIINRLVVESREKTSSKNRELIS